MHASKVIFEEFIAEIIDIPYIIFGVISLWRIPIIVNYILKYDGNHMAKDVRNKAKHQAWMSLMDLVSLICFVFLLVSGYRIPILYNKIKVILNTSLFDTFS
jgi:hypothetical protein